MSLLDDLHEDLISDALAKPAAKRERSDWVESVTWRHTGYLARMIERKCPRCEKINEIQSLGVFAEEVGSNSTRRLTKAHQFPLQALRQRVEVTTEPGELCFSCLGDLGFTEIVEAPGMPTNIAGQGMFTSASFRQTLGFVRPEPKEREARVARG